MSKNNSTGYKVKDFIIEFGKAFKITKIEKANKANNHDPLIHYQSYFVTPKQHKLFCTIPLSKIELTSSRKPISAKRARSILRSLAVSAQPLDTLTPVEPEDVLLLNNISQTSAMVKTFWAEKQDPEKSFPSSKDTLYQNGLNQMTEELAVVLGSNYNDMRNKVLRALKKN